MRLTLKRLLKVLACLVLLGGALGVYAFVIEPNWLRVKVVPVAIEGLPPEFDGYRIAVLSDLHVGGRWPGAMSRVRRAVNLTASRSPDLVLIAGDYCYGRVDALDECFEHLGRLRPPDGVLTVLGNHDHWVNADAVRSHIKAAGMAELKGSHVSIQRHDARIWIAGVDDLWEGHPSIEAAIAGIPAGETTILLSHNPDIAPAAAGLPVDLMISGHTHGGQVWLPVIGARYVPSKYGSRYRTGLIREGRLQIYVTVGVGMIEPSVRFLCRPEVTILTLRRPS